MNRAFRVVAGIVQLAAVAGCGAAAPGEPLRRDSLGVAIVENRRPASRGEWRLEVAAARPIEPPATALAGEAPPAGVIAGHGFAIAGGHGEITWYDRQGRRTRSVTLPEEPVLGALYGRSGGRLLAWDPDRLAAIDLGMDGSPAPARAYGAMLPRGAVTPLGAFDDGSLLVSVRDASMFQVADEPGRDTVEVLRLGLGGAHARIFTLPGPAELTWGGPGGAIRIPAPFSSDVLAVVSGDRMWVADGPHGELRAYDAAGRLRAIVRAPIRGDPVDPADVARWRDRLHRLARGHLPDDARLRLERSLAIPATWPSFAAVLPGPRGELWIRAGSGPGRRARWNVFAADGEWLAELAVPGQFELIAAAEGYVLVGEHRSGRIELVTIRGR